MSRPRWMVLAGLTALLGFVPAGAGATAQEATGRPADTPAPTKSLGIDNLFTHVGLAVRDFAGMYLDPDAGTMVVRMKGANRGQAERAAERLRRKLHDHGDLGRLQVLNAEFSFLELRRWYEPLSKAVLRLDGVASTDIDERTNRLDIGVTSVDGHAAVERSVRALRMPAGMVTVSRVAPPVEENGLSDRHRPVVGGHRVTPESGTCTVFPVMRQGVNGYLTNSHCTHERVVYPNQAVQDTAFYQGGVSATNRIGVEHFDPSYHVSALDEYGCPAATPCRLSDAAFVKRDVGVSSSLGQIARPLAVYPNAGYKDWNTGNTFRIVRELNYPVAGEPVTKVGATTGRSQGQVTKTCQAAPSGSVVYLCQDSASYASAQGDSGSPVFLITHSPLQNDVRLVGIHRAGGGVFSAIGTSNVQYAPTELGSLSTCIPGGPFGEC